MREQCRRDVAGLKILPIRLVTWKDRSLSRSISVRAPFAVLALSSAGVAIGFGAPWSKKWSKCWEARFADIDVVLIDDRRFFFRVDDRAFAQVLANGSVQGTLEHVLSSQKVRIERTRVSRFLTSRNRRAHD